MRKETRKYICAELLNYQRSRKELNRIKEKLEEIKLFPAYGTEYYTAEKLMYYQDRVQFLQKITEAIAAAEQDATPEEKQLLFFPDREHSMSAWPRIFTINTRSAVR